MGKRTSEAESTTIYRLTGPLALVEAIKQSYVEDGRATSTECKVGDREALLVHASLGSGTPGWVQRVEALTHESISATNATAGAALLIPSEGADGAVWALCWGMGWLLLDPSRLDAAFGQRVALRCCQSDRLSSLTRRTMDERAKVDRSSIPAGESLAGFGIGGFGELVTRLVARAKIPSLTSDKEFTLRGADSLKVPLGKSPSDLLADLDVLEATLAQPADPALEILEQLVAVRRDSSVFRDLESQLNDALHFPDNPAIEVSIGWPHEYVDEHGTPEGYKVKGVGQKGQRVQVTPGLPTAQDLSTWLRDRDDRLSSLDTIRIQLFADIAGDNPASREIPLRRWLAWETELDDVRYFLHSGDWYRMNNEYALKLDAKISGIFARQWSGTLPKWKEVEDEEAYNIRAAVDIGALKLDRELIRTSQTPRGFEACDILTADGELIHVKSIGSSSPASHLFAQGANSAHALQMDDEAKRKLRDRVQKLGWPRTTVHRRPPAVVFGLARKGGKTINPANLYSFSKVTLARVYDELSARGIDVYVVPIENE